MQNTLIYRLYCQDLRDSAPPSRVKITYQRTGKYWYQEPEKSPAYLTLTERINWRKREINATNTN